MDGVDLVQMTGKSILGYFHNLGMILLLELGVLRHLGKVVAQILYLIRQLAHRSGMIHVPRLQLLGMFRLQLGNLPGKICSFVHTSLHVS